MNTASRALRTLSALGLAASLTLGSAAVALPAQANVPASVQVAAKKAPAKKVVFGPGSARPASAWTCPAKFPIKGNAQSGIFHQPKNRFYSKTKPEICFNSAAAAVKHGYRAAKV